MSFPEAVKRGLTQTFSWEGGAFRAEYWWFSLFGIICCIAGFAPAIAWEVPVVALGWLLVIVPTPGVFVRRMHDTGRSGWSWFWSWMPLIGLIGLCGFLCERGGPKANEYSRPPGTKVDW